MAARTPIALQPDALLGLHAAHPDRYPVLFESAAQGDPLGRYDVLLACPADRLVLRGDGTLHATFGDPGAITFLEALDQWFSRERVPCDKPEESLFSGGWFLFLGYELAGQIEPSLKLPTSTASIVAIAVRAPAAIVVERRRGLAWIVEEDSNSGCASRITADLSALESLTTPPSDVLSAELKEEPPKRYFDAVAAALEHIAAGDIYQANLSRRWYGQLAHGIVPHHVYQRLRRSNPAPFAALATFDDFAIVSSSPERLINIRDGKASTRPIAGTRPRRTDRSDDIEKLRELHSHPKERAEHVMLIDLERNDLGRICEAGTVKVDEFMTLESYAHVHHIVSNVSGKLRHGVTPGQVLAAVFPGGTITGCPKVRCMQVIAALEQTPRGAYTGSIGYLNRDGSMDMNILIRTLEIHGREVSFRAGAGIVADSQPERELEETRAKARGLINALVKEGAE